VRTLPLGGSGRDDYHRRMSTEDAGPALTPSRNPDRMTNDKAALRDLLDDAQFGVIAAVMHDGPVGMPVSFARDGDRIILHGSSGSHRMRVLSDGAPVCFTVTIPDALSVGRTAFHTGMRYRSAMVFGACRPVPESQKKAMLDLYLDRYLPGRSGEIRPVTAKELAATMVLSLPIQTWSMKVSSGWPIDESDGEDGAGWMGLLPLHQGVGTPQGNPALDPSVDVPASVLAAAERFRQQTP
jgi:uncharacterized protein